MTPPVPKEPEIVKQHYVLQGDNIVNSYADLASAQFQNTNNSNYLESISKLLQM